MSAGLNAPRGPDAQRVYAEDLVLGVAYPLGSHTVSEAEIVDFASVWDPQFFHVDAETADQTSFGGLIASGIHTLAVYQRLCVTAEYSTWKMVAGKSIRELRFLAPVRPGDELTGRFVIEERNPDGRGRAILTLACDLRNQMGTVVMKMTLECVVLMRSGDRMR